MERIRLVKESPTVNISTITDFFKPSINTFAIRNLASQEVKI